MFLGESLWHSPFNHECQAALSWVSTWRGDRVGKMTCCRFPAASVLLFSLFIPLFSFLKIFFLTKWTQDHSLIDNLQMQEKNINISQLRISCQMFYCKAQVPGQQISTPPILCTASFNRGGIWSQHMNAKPTQFLVWGIPLDKGIT